MKGVVTEWMNNYELYSQLQPGEMNLECYFHMNSKWG